MNSIQDLFFWISGSQKRSCFRMASLGLCTIKYVLCAPNLHPKNLC